MEADISSQAVGLASSADFSSVFSTINAPKEIIQIQPINIAIVGLREKL